MSRDIGERENFKLFIVTTTVPPVATANM